MTLGRVQLQCEPLWHWCIVSHVNREESACTVCGFWNLSYPRGMPLVGSWRSAAGETNKDDNSPLLYTHTHTLIPQLCLSLFSLHISHILSLINSYQSTFCFSSVPLHILAVEWIFYLFVQKKGPNPIWIYTLISLFGSLQKLYVYMSAKLIANINNLDYLINICVLLFLNCDKDVYWAGHCVVKKSACQCSLVDSQCNGSSVLQFFVTY